VFTQAAALVKGGRQESDSESAELFPDNVGVDSDIQHFDANVSLAFERGSE
jgi:hypothetical protein